MTKDLSKQICEYNLEILKQELLERYDISNINDVEIIVNKKGAKRLKIADALICYYDKENEMLYGETLHGWINNYVRYRFYIPVDQRNWLFKRLDKLNNHLSLKTINQRGRVEV